MMALLDLTGPWFWILYTLAGTAVAHIAEPMTLNAAGQLERDLFAAHPAARALLLMVLWLFWPLVACLLLAGRLLWVWDSLVLGVDWIRYGAGLLFDRIRHHRSEGSR